MGELEKFSDKVTSLDNQLMEAQGTLAMALRWWEQHAAKSSDAPMWVEAARVIVTELPERL